MVEADFPHVLNLLTRHILVIQQGKCSIQFFLYKCLSVTNTLAYYTKLKRTI
jgi:hypothetical protein